MIQLMLRQDYVQNVVNMITVAFVGHICQMEKHGLTVVIRFCQKCIDQYGGENLLDVVTGENEKANFK